MPGYAAGETVSTLEVARVTTTPPAQAEIGGPGWWAVATSAEITSNPRRVVAGDHVYTAFRAGPGEPVSVVSERCPHRLVRLENGSVVGGRLRCPYHGWEFGGDGACALVPSAGPDAEVPPRARLDRPWGVREQDGMVWVAPAEPGEQDAPFDLRARDEVFTNLDPSLRAGWHPVALGDEVPAGAAPLPVRLLGEQLTVVRTPEGQVRVEPRPAGVQERFGVVWVAPEKPRVELFDAPDDADPRFAQGWLVPARSASAAGVLADNFLDVAHFPFVHAGTFGAAEEPYVPALEVSVDGDQLTSVQEQWFDNPEDPAVLAGLRPERQRRRATYFYRAPFQLYLRLEELDAGAVKTILFFLQPEDLDSTRIYTKMLLHNIGGVGVPGPDVVAKEVAFEVAVLAEDLALQKAMSVTGLPLRMRDELHVRSDRSGIALRRILRRWYETP
jgi:phenylpropionate dioxygenase-like ring-hydroxylating dioxygenase large terminal subunit